MKPTRFFGTLCLLLVMALFNFSLAENHPASATSSSTLVLNGSNYLQGSNSPWLNPSMGITLEAWVKLPQFTPGYLVIDGLLIDHSNANKRWQAVKPKEKTRDSWKLINSL